MHMHMHAQALWPRAQLQAAWASELPGAGLSSRLLKALPSSNTALGAKGDPVPVPEQQHNTPWARCPLAAPQLCDPTSLLSAHNTRTLAGEARGAGLPFCSGLSLRVCLC